MEQEQGSPPPPPWLQRVSGEDSARSPVGRAARECWGHFAFHYPEPGWAKAHPIPAPRGEEGRNKPRWGCPEEPPTSCRTQCFNKTLLDGKQPLRLQDQALALLQTHVPAQKKPPKKNKTKKTNNKKTLSPSGAVFLTPEINIFSRSQLLAPQKKANQPHGEEPITPQVLQG